MRPTIPAAAALATLLVVAACGGGSPTAVPTAGGQPTVAPPTTAATEAPPTVAATEAATAVTATCEDVTDAGGAAAVEAAAAGFEWAPNPITAKVGDVITWTNADTVPHGVATDDGSCRMAENMRGGATGSLTFTVAGEFPYHCTVHPNMKGTIVITE